MAGRHVGSKGTNCWARGRVGHVGHAGDLTILTGGGGPAPRTRNAGPPDTSLPREVGGVPGEAGGGGPPPRTRNAGPPDAALPRLSGEYPAKPGEGGHCAAR